MKNKELSWQWKGKAIPMSKMSEGQLLIAKEYIKKTDGKFIFGKHKSVYKKEIQKIEKQYQQKASEELAQMIIKNQFNRVCIGVDKLISQHKLFKNMMNL